MLSTKFSQCLLLKQISVLGLYCYINTKPAQHTHFKQLITEIQALMDNFDNLTFSAATNAMRKRGLPNNIIAWYSHFLHNQVSTMELGNSMFSRRLVVGAPQGGVMSPTIWNINFDPILKSLNTNKPVKVIGYADDALIMITGHVPEVMVKRIQPSINAMVEWGTKSGLKFNHSKTQVVLFTNKKAREYRAKITINDLPIEFSAEANYLGMTLDSRLNWNSHIKTKVSKCRQLMFTIKNKIAKTTGPKPSLTRRAYKSLVIPIISYGCHLFAAKLEVGTFQNELSKLNRLACLSLGSVPLGTPTMTMEIIYDLKPLDLEMQSIAIKTYSRIKSRLPYIWDGRPTKGVARVGHLKYWADKISQYDMAVAEGVCDKQVKSRMWIMNFKVLDFEANRNDAKEVWGSYTFYSDGSRLADHTGYGCLFVCYNASRRDACICELCLHSIVEFQ
jgi:hypothetical protein